MTTQTNLDLTDKQPTALMRLEKIVRECMSKENESFDIGWNAAIEMVIEEIEQLKPSELADLKQAFGDGYTETESAETWSKKWGVGCRQPLVIGSVCTCTKFRETPMINDKHICSICNKPIVQTDL